MNEDWREGLTDEELFEKWDGLIKKKMRETCPNVRSWDENQKDLYQEGCLALWRSIQQYNPEGGAKFSTYASINIERALKRWWRLYFYKTDSIKLDAISYDVVYEAQSNSNHQNEDIAFSDYELKAPEQIYLKDFLDSLTDRQKTIFKMAATGACRDEIMDATGVSHQTIATDKQDMRKKFDEYVYSY